MRSHGADQALQAASRWRYGRLALPGPSRGASLLDGAGSVRSSSVVEADVSPGTSQSVATTGGDARGARPAVVAHRHTVVPRPASRGFGRSVAPDTNVLLARRAGIVLRSDGECRLSFRTSHDRVWCRALTRSTARRLAPCPDSLRATAAPHEAALAHMFHVEPPRPPSPEACGEHRKHACNPRGLGSMQVAATSRSNVSAVSIGLASWALSSPLRRVAAWQRRRLVIGGAPHAPGTTVGRREKRRAV